MKLILQQVGRYYYDLNKVTLAGVTLLTASLVFINYHYGLDKHIRELSFFQRFATRFIIFFIAFCIPYLLVKYLQSPRVTFPLRFYLLLLIAPALFSFRMALTIPIHFSQLPGWNIYWNYVFYWPLRLTILFLLLFVIWQTFDADQPFYGMTKKKIRWQPYFVMLLIMLPLIALASAQPAFHTAYPKLQTITGIADTPLTAAHKMLFELCYGMDFFSVELFFRGFLVLAFIKWAGKNAILPMAGFYCMIHLGKPLAECISSYFGGMILGVIVYYTRSIWGGLIVHLGIAWMMEVMGYFHPFS